MLLRATGIVALTASNGTTAGIGKTTLAKVMCHDDQVRERFADGVQWLAFGRERSGLAVLCSLAERLAVRPDGDERALCKAVSARLAGRQLLLVFDDVWSAEQVEAFAGLTTGSSGLLAMLLTTRSTQLATSYGESLQLAQLSDAASLSLLGKLVGPALKAADEEDTEVLLRACRGNAAMLQSVAALSRKRGVAGAVTYLAECRAKQQHASLPDADEYGTLFAALEGTLGSLDSTEAARRAAMLAVFPEDTSVPLALLSLLWGAAALEAELPSLADSHFVDVDWRKRTLAMIDLHHDYLRCRGKTELAGWHGELLRCCGRRAIGTDARDQTDAYWGNGRRWCYHLCEGGHAAIDAVRSTVVDLKLTSLALGPREGDAIVALVQACDGLASVDISYNNFDEDCALRVVRATRPCDSVRSLRLGSCKVGSGQTCATGAEEIGQYVNSSASLTELSLEYNQLTSDGGKAIASALCTNSRLTSLNLSDNVMGPPAAEALAAMLRANSTLRVLVLTNLHRSASPPERTDMRGFVAIAHALRVNRGLESLTLCSNDLDAQAGSALAAALSAGTSLTSLDVGFNRLDMASAGSIVAAARQRDTIATLGLAACSLGATGASELAEYMSSSATLSSLDLRQNAMGAEGAAVILGALMASRLKECDLRYNSLGSEGKQMAKDVVKSREGLTLQVQ